MSKRSTPDIFLGLLVMLGLVGVVFQALRAANLTSFSEGDTYRISARFDNIGGLKARAAVRSSGVLVGRVKSISLDPKTFQGVVEMAVRSSLELPRDTSAKIQTSGLLGDQYIGLEAGGDTVNLKPGDTIKLTQSALVLEQLIGQILFSKPADAGVEPTNSGGKKP